MNNIAIVNGKIIDGTGNPAFLGCVEIKNSKITQVTNSAKIAAETVIDARGMVVCPGFIDIHSHADNSIFYNPFSQSAAAQGVTTIVAGNCGDTLGPISVNKLPELLLKKLLELDPDLLEKEVLHFGDVLDLEETMGTSLNFLHYIGHNTIRSHVMGGSADPPDAIQLEQMKKLVEEGMHVGAIGLSTGLLYPPGMFAYPSEIHQLAEIIARYNGVYSSHIRSYGQNLMESVLETIEVAKQTKVNTLISHLSVFGHAHWGMSTEVLRKIENHRNMGYQIFGDVHPYDSVATILAAILPPWMFAGGYEQLKRRLHDPEIRSRLKSEMEGGVDGWKEWLPYEDRPWENIIVLMKSISVNYVHNGKTISEISRELGKEPLTVYFDLLEADAETAGMILKQLRSIDDMINFAKHPYIAFESDEDALDVSSFRKGRIPHPRMFGTFPKILGEFVRKKKLFRLEEGIRKMTSLPAQYMQIHNRGLLRGGFQADIVIFDPNRIDSAATYGNPYQFPTGIHLVMVNGQVVMQEGEHTRKKPGRILRHLIN